MNRSDNARGWELVGKAAVACLVACLFLTALGI